MSPARSFHLPEATGVADDTGLRSPAWDVMVQQWPGWLMLVDSERRLLACSQALERALGQACPRCTDGVRFGPPGGCCLDFAELAGSAAGPVLVQVGADHHAAARVAVARAHPTKLNDGSGAWWVQLEPVAPDDWAQAAEPWRPTVQMALGSSGGADSALEALTQRWVRPLIRPKWVAWLQRDSPGVLRCQAPGGRLPVGLTVRDIVASVDASPGLVGKVSPATVPLGSGGQVLHLITPGRQGGWVLAMVGGRIDTARVALLQGLVDAVGDMLPGAAFAVVGGATIDANGVLSPRETQVVALIAQGLPDKRIAIQLGLSFHTVRNHVRRIMRKLAVSHRAQIAFALTAREGGQHPAASGNH